MDLKEPGNELFLIGRTRDEMGGSHYHLVQGMEGGQPPQVDLGQAPGLFHGLHQATQRGLVRACHDLSEGGLAVAIAEMAFAGGVGADLTTVADADRPQPDEVLLFAESTTRFLVEVPPAKAAAFPNRRAPACGSAYAKRERCAESISGPSSLKSRLPRPTISRSRVNTTPS